MKTLNSENVRLLFILDNDYGELTMAMFFLHGRNLAARSTLLLPPRLHATNGGNLSVRTLPYHSYEELLRIIKNERPGIVFLFSGYLLPIHGLLTVDELQKLVDLAKHEGCRVVTYDPFWGLMSSPHAVFGAHFLQTGNSLPFIKLGRYAIARLSKTFKTLTGTADILRDLVHVNPAPVVSDQVRVSYFFNPSLLRSNVNGATEKSSGMPYWLFILSKEDYSRQKILRGRPAFPFAPPSGGRERFAATTAQTLRQTAAAGRRAILLGPDEFVTEVKERISVADGVEFITFCSYDRFLSLLCEAEYVFYWNAISSSSLIRLINSRPVFYFDRGHIAQGLEPVYKQTVQLYYHGWEPIYLDQERELKPEALSELADRFREATSHIRDNMRTSPTPEQMIESILQ